MRRLTEGERELTRSVFGDAIDLDRVRIAPRLPGRTAVTTGSTINFPRDGPFDFAIEPPQMQAWLVHELVHVWQFQTRRLNTLVSWALTAASGGYGPSRRGYRYTHPFDWDRLNLEQQASAVEHAFLLREGAATTEPPLALADFEGLTPFAALTRTV